MCLCFGEDDLESTRGEGVSLGGEVWVRIALRCVAWVWISGRGSPQVQVAARWARDGRPRCGCLRVRDSGNRRDEDKEQCWYQNGHALDKV